jgi:23S rRNA U2552 (ribose-2'-O)-methylase RlmE/FtsJ
LEDKGESKNNNSNVEFSDEELAFQNRTSALKEILLSGNNKILKNDSSKNDNLNENNFKKIQINGVISDMAPNSSGDNQVDHWRIMDLALAASEFAKKNLSKGGYFVTKIFFGGSEKEFVNSLKKHFKEIVFFKPDSSRKDSSELYIVAKNFIKK